MRLLAESSAVLTWLLDEPRSAEVGALLANAELTLTSNLTWIECDRALHRYSALGHRTETEIAATRARLARASAVWTSVDLTLECQQHARGRFPVEPIRTLDAFHLATLLLAAQWVPKLQLLSLDARIRDNAQALGFQILPA